MDDGLQEGEFVGNKCNPGYLVEGRIGAGGSLICGESAKEPQSQPGGHQCY